MDEGDRVPLRRDVSESMNQYELLYIIPTSFTDEEVGAVETKVNALLTKLGAETTSTKRLGKLRLTYAIKNEHHGHYVMVNFNLAGKDLAKLDETLRITPEVLRHLIVRLEDDGADQKFEMVQFTEVNLDNREEKPRRPKTEVKEDANKSESATEEASESKNTMTAEDIEKKIEGALNEDTQGV